MHEKRDHLENRCPFFQRNSLAAVEACQPSLLSYVPSTTSTLIHGSIEIVGDPSLLFATLRYRDSPRGMHSRPAEPLRLGYLAVKLSRFSAAIDQATSIEFPSKLKAEVTVKWSCFTTDHMRRCSPPLSCNRDICVFRLHGR